MKWLKKLKLSLLISVIISLMMPCVAFAQEAYTYTVTLYTGNQGTITDDEEKLEEAIVVETSGDDIEVVKSDDKIVIRGLHYNDRVSFYTQNMIELTNKKYYVSGIRKSGRDNSELELASYVVRGDKDYVVAYAIRGNMVEYTVNYQDASGNVLLESNTFYGNVGENPVIAYRYVDGYRPQAYNLTKTLSSNAAENVFTFVYNKIETTTAGNDSSGDTDAEQETEEDTTSEKPAEDNDTEEDSFLEPIKHVITIIKNTVVEENSTGGNEDTTGDDQSTGGGITGADNNASEDGADAESIWDSDTPLSLLDLSEDQMPLTNMRDDGLRPGTEKNVLPLYVGVATISLLALIFLFIYLGRKKKKEESEQQ